MKKQQARVDKDLSAAQMDNKRLQESLQEAEERLPRLRKQLEEHEQAKAERAVSPPNDRCRFNAESESGMGKGSLHTKHRNRSVGICCNFVVQYKKIEGEKNTELLQQNSKIQGLTFSAGLKVLLIKV